MLKAICGSFTENPTLQGCRSCGAPLDSARSVNPISKRGADYAHRITTYPPQIFRPSLRPCDYVQIGFHHLPSPTLLDLKKPTKKCKKHLFL